MTGVEAMFAKYLTALAIFRPPHQLLTSGPSQPWPIFEGVDQACVYWIRVPLPYTRRALTFILLPDTR